MVKSLPAWSFGLLPLRWYRQISSLIGTNARDPHSRHVILGLWHIPDTHSFRQTNA
jgi:hypothetical protein